MTRDTEGVLHVLENRCAHRGNAPRLQCVYHQWTYDLRGHLRGVPMRGGAQGKGGMPERFDLRAHGLEALRVETLPRYARSDSSKPT